MRYEPYLRNDNVGKKNELKLNKEQDKKII